MAFRKKTVFVVGAGANHDLRMPLGSDLKAEIIESLKFTYDSWGKPDGHSGNNKIASALQKLEQHDKANRAYWNKCDLISRGLSSSPSIDDFVETHRPDEFLAKSAKVAISFIISERETASHLKPLNPHRYEFEVTEDVMNSWLNQLMILLSTGVNKENIDTLFDNVRFITFNYDRCIEHFLYYTIQSRFGVTDGVASRLISGLDILHTYGSLGHLQWQYPTGKLFGYSDPDLIGMAGGLLTYTEQMSDESKRTRINDWLLKADRIIMLGFGFIKQNMDLLFQDIKLSPNTRFYGTCYGISEPNLKHYRNDLGYLREGSFSTNGIVLEARTAKDFLSDFSEELTR